MSKTLLPLLLIPSLALAACGDKDDDPSGDTGGTSAIDADGDGFTEADDCDDTDATVFPGAEEVCDGVDQDCDGTADNDAVDALTRYADADGDGFGNPELSEQVCEEQEGLVADDTDCDDTYAEAYPGAEEQRCNGLVEDCDGAVVDGDHYVPEDFAILQEAVDAAAEGEAICVSDGTYAPVVIDKTLTLAALPGNSEVIVDAEDVGPPLSIAGASGVTVFGLTLTGGLTDSAMGAGVSVDEAPDTHLWELTVEGNTCSFCAGGIGVLDSPGLVVEDTLVTGNVGIAGGMWAVSSPATIEGSSFTENQGGAGGLFLQNFGETEIIDGWFASNTALLGGGVLAIEGDALTITGGTFISNLAQDTGGSDDGQGGAVYAEDVGTIEVSGTSSLGDRAELGGVFQVQGADEVTLSANTWEDGIGATWAVMLTDVGSVTVEGDHFSGNTGGGLATFTTDASLVWQSSFEGNTGVGGAGLYINNAVSAEVIECDFTTNAAPGGVGAGALVSTVDSLIVGESTFTKNSVSPTGYGGGLALESVVEGLVHDLVFVGNEGDAGASLALVGGGEFDLVNLDISGSIATGIGGGVIVASVVRADFEGGEITENEATLGGGIYCAYSAMELDADVHDNLPDNVYCDDCLGCSPS